MGHRVTLIPGDEVASGLGRANPIVCLQRLDGGAGMRPFALAGPVVFE